MSLPTPLDLVSRWAVSSQQRARRNAMVASTTLTQRRVERLEVEHYLARATAAPHAPQASVPRVPAPRGTTRRTAAAGG